MAIRKKTKYITTDGKEFDTLNAAEAHEKSLGESMEILVTVRYRDRFNLSDKEIYRKLGKVQDFSNWKSEVYQFVSDIRTEMKASVTKAVK